MKDNTPLLFIWVSVLIWVVTILSTYIIIDLKTKSIADRVIDQTLTLEYDKVGWKENYDKITEIQRSQIIESLKQFDLQWGEQNVPQADNPNSGAEWSNISLDQAKKVTSENTYVLWNPDAEITWVEYSDIECPYCKKLHQSWAIEEILEQYDGKVNFVFKQFPLAFHKQAQMEAEAALCVWDLWWTDIYYEFITKAFEGSQGNGNSYTKESISELWWNLWIDKNDLLTCIESWKFKEQVENEMEEWSSMFGITGTPWNVLINNVTWAWDKLPWAYPASSFKEKIDWLLQ